MEAKGDCDIGGDGEGVTIVDHQQLEARKLDAAR